MADQINYTATRNYLNSHRNKGVKYDLDKVRSIIATLGHPEKKFPCIHIAGTNGKGSTCAMLEAVYRANGYRTGLYTSPHLVHEGEMIQIGRRPLSEIDIILYVKKLKPIALEISKRHSDGHPSFFELMTIMAFIHFAEKQVDLAILETGVGGRLDATNVVDPELSIITSISLDHTELLGDTIDQIAMEKAGILKPERPVLIGNLCEEAESVVRQVAQEKNCTLYSVHERFPDIEKLPKTNLVGSLQQWNAAVAIYATEILNKRFSVDSIKTFPILQTVQWPGRWQKLQLGDKTLILDATHNQGGVDMLKENLESLIRNNQIKPVIITGTTGELRARYLMPVIGQYARELHLVTPKQPNATPSHTLEKYLTDEHKVPVSHSEISTLFPVPETCIAGKPGDTIVVTGSIYLVGEVLRQLHDQNQNEHRTFNITKSVPNMNGFE